MKLPTSVTTKPSSGFHICDILELNKDKNKDEQKQSKNQHEIKRDVEIDENCDNDNDDDDDDNHDVQKENLSSESDENNLLNESITVDQQHTAENVMKRRHSLSPTSQNNDTESQHGDEEESSQDSNHRLSRHNKLKMKHIKHSKRNESEDNQQFNSLGHAGTAANHHQQLLSDTIHQYSSHLFQNHPAMRPWFNPNGKFNYNLI